MNKRQLAHLEKRLLEERAPGKGVGLGLALSYAIIDEAGGRIRCENREEGGALFTVELPLEKSADELSNKETANGVY